MTGLGYREIYKRFRTGITSGKLMPGSKIPSIRGLASELGVAKKTVEAAYEALASDGLIISESRKGNFVNPTLSVTLRGGRMNLIQ